MDLREIEWGGMDWIDLAQDRDQWRVMNLRVPLSTKVDTTSPTSGGRSFGIVHSRAKATEFSCLFLLPSFSCCTVALLTRKATIPRANNWYYNV
jgi:hypothetical protein